jgi:hypothetical protein
MQFDRPLQPIGTRGPQKSLMMPFGAPLSFMKLAGTYRERPDDWLRAERELREPSDGTDNEAA